MFNYLKITFFVISLCAINWANDACAQPGIDSLFIKWNKVTFQSLEQQKTSGDNIEAMLYRNRIDVVKGDMEIDSISSITLNSLRYRFLKILHSKYNFEKSVLFVFEANESGYMVTLRNLVVHIDSSSNANIDFYEFFSGKWNLMGNSVLNNFSINSNLLNYLTSFGDGFNNNGDIIVTKFNNSNLDDCQYYLIGTLSNKSGFNKLIDANKSKIIK